MALIKKYYSGSQVFDIIRELPGKEFLLMLNAFAKASGADVAEVKHGKWEKNGKCNLCGEHAPFFAMASAYYKSNFCPNCGADMRERREDVGN